MAKRVGLARQQALIENLKRELNMRGATFTNVDVGGGTFTGAGTGLSGSGLQSGSIAAPLTYVANSAGDIVTTIQLDLQNLSGSTLAAGTIVGNAEAMVQGGSAGGSPAYLYQHSNDTNGILYKAEVSCIETIAGGCVNADFDISGSTLGVYEQGDTVAGSPITVYTMGADITGGQTISSTTNLSSSNDYFMYLVTGAPGSGANGQFTAGKLIIRLYGAKDF